MTTNKDYKVYGPFSAGDRVNISGSCFIIQVSGYYASTGDYVGINLLADVGMHEDPNSPIKLEFVAPKTSIWNNERPWDDRSDLELKYEALKVENERLKDRVVLYQTRCEQLEHRLDSIKYQRK